MDFISVIVVIGIIAGIVGNIKDSAKKADDKVREKRNSSIGSVINKISFEKIESYIGEDAIDEFKSYVGYKENNEYRNDYEEPLPKKAVKKKKKKPSKKVDNLYTSEKIINVNPVDVIRNKPNKRKKNPFEFTNNPVTNAIIASEILGKPKCKK